MARAGTAKSELIDMIPGSYADEDDRNGEAIFFDAEHVQLKRSRKKFEEVDRIITVSLVLGPITDLSNHLHELAGTSTKRTVLQKKKQNKKEFTLDNNFVLFKPYIWQLDGTTTIYKLITVCGLYYYLLHRSSTYPIHEFLPGNSSKKLLQREEYDPLFRVPSMNKRKMVWISEK